MEIDYIKNGNHSKVYYGETFVSQLKKETFASKQIVLLTNQRYYDLFSEKFSQFFLKEDVHWYICTNDRTCNNFNELQDILKFFSEMSYEKGFMMIGIGNEGIMQLSKFLSTGLITPAYCWLVPLSVSALSQGLLSSATIEFNNQAMLMQRKLADKVTYDSTLIKEYGEDKLIDLFVFIQCAVVCDYSFLQSLYKNFADASKVKHSSFGGLFEEFIRCHEEMGEEIEGFGQLFTQGFFQTLNGHLLSIHMKRLLGMLLQLLWAQKVSGFDFHFKNFLIWLIHLGFPVDFPEQIVESDYVDGINDYLNKGKKALLLEDIGQPKTFVVPEIADLLATVTDYKKILTEIRGA